VPTKKRRSIFDVMDEYLENFEEWTEKFEDIIFERPSWNCITCTIEPLRNLLVTSDEAILTVDLPYAEESTIRVTPAGKDKIEISAKMRRKVSFNDLGITHYKGEFHKFHCQIRIPVSVYMERMEVRFKKGILEIRLPRKREHEIPVE